MTSKSPRPSDAADAAVPDENAPGDLAGSLTELEQLVTRLERGDLPLEEALRAFERGIELTRHCQGALRSAQHKVEILLRRGEQHTTESFSPQAGDTTDDGAAGKPR